MLDHAILKEIILVYPQGDKVSLMELLEHVHASVENYNPVKNFSFTSTTVHLLIQEIVELKGLLNKIENED